MELERSANSMNASNLLTRRGPDLRNWNRILGFRLASPQLLLLLRLLLLLQVHLLRPGSPQSLPATWRRSHSFSFTTSPLWRESLVRELIGECRWRELAILTRTMNVRRSFGFPDSTGWEIFVLFLFFILILWLGFQFLMEFVFHHKLEFFCWVALFAKSVTKVNSEIQFFFSIHLKFSQETNKDYLYNLFVIFLI